MAWFRRLLIGIATVLGVALVMLWVLMRMDSADGGLSLDRMWAHLASKSGRPVEALRTEPTAEPAPVADVALLAASERPRVDGDAAYLVRALPGSSPLAGAAPIRMERASESDSPFPSFVPPPRPRRAAFSAHTAESSAPRAEATARTVPDLRRTRRQEDEHTQREQHAPSAREKRAARDRDEEERPARADDTEERTAREHTEERAHREEPEERATREHSEERAPGGSAEELAQERALARERAPRIVVDAPAERPAPAAKREDDAPPAAAAPASITSSPPAASGEASPVTIVRQEKAPSSWFDAAAMVFVLIVIYLAMTGNLSTLTRRRAGKR